MNEKQLYFFRIAFGLVMMIYCSNKCTDETYEPNIRMYFDFKHRIPSILQYLFVFFPWYSNSLYYWKMHCPLMLLSAAGMAFGQGSVSQWSCLLFSLLKAILLLLDQTKYNNHEYLYSTLALVLFFIDCHDFMEYSLLHKMTTKDSSVRYQKLFSITLCISLLALMLNNAVYGIAGWFGLCNISIMLLSVVMLFDDSKPIKSSRSSWDIWYLQVFIGVVYFYAGMAKTDIDWLSGATAKQLLTYWSMDANFSQNTASIVKDFIIQTTHLSEIQFYQYFAFSGLLLDISAIFGLMSPWRWIRVLYTVALISFHVCNHFLFIIETFPFVMICTCALYHDSSWMTFVSRVVNSTLDTIVRLLPWLSVTVTCCAVSINVLWRKLLKPTVMILLLLCHLLVPLRCSISSVLDQGNISWSTSCQYFQWRMMSRSVEVIASHLRFVHPVSGEMQIITLDMLGIDLCSRTSDISTGASSNNKQCSELKEFLFHVPQYEDRLYEVIKDARGRALAPEDSIQLPPKVFADVWLEINGPPIQRFVIPSIDIGSIESLHKPSNNSLWGNIINMFNPPSFGEGWIQPRIEEFRSLEWMTRMQLIEANEKIMYEAQLSNNKDTRNSTMRVLFVADIPSSGESYFYFYRPARVSLLRGVAYLDTIGIVTSDSNDDRVCNVDGTCSQEFTLHGIVKWYAMKNEKINGSDAVLWKIVLPEGRKYFDMKPFDDRRI